MIDGDRVLNPGGLRRPDEFVRHKALDAIGDLCLLGAPLIGRFEGRLRGPRPQQRAGPRPAGPSAGLADPHPRRGARPGGLTRAVRMARLRASRGVV